MECLQAFHLNSTDVTQFAVAIINIYHLLLWYLHSLVRVSVSRVSVLPTTPAYRTPNAVRRLIKWKFQPFLNQSHATVLWMNYETGTEKKKMHSSTRTLCPSLSRTDDGGQRSSFIRISLRVVVDGLDIDHDRLIALVSGSSPARELLWRSSVASRWSVGYYTDLFFN